MEEQIEHGFSGVVLIARGDQTVFSEAYGYLDCAKREPLKTTDVFLIGSITKTFTRASIGVLVRQGALALDTQLQRFYPDAPPDKREITIEQLLNHRAGLADIIDEQGKAIAYSTEWDYQPVDRALIEDRILRSTLLYAPGTDRQYANSGYSLLAAIIERASGQPYEAFVQEQLLAPAGMRTTGYTRVDWSQHRLVAGCFADGRRWPHPVTDRRWMQDGPSWNLRGNGGMLGTADDLLRWIRTYVNATEPAIRLRTGQSKTFKTRAASAAGGNGIFNAVYLWLERDDLTVILLSHHEGHPGEAFLLELARHVLEG